MRESTIAHYVRLADKDAYGYQTYGGDAAIAALRCFRGYHPQARLAWTDVNGRQRWMTPTMLRIHAVLSRESMRPNGELVRIRAMAEEARTSPGYFTKVLERFTAWGMFASISVRGRSGGIYLFARTVGDTFERFAIDARRHLQVVKEGRAAKLIRKLVNVSSYTYERREGTTEETFRGWMDEYLREASVVTARMAGYRGPGGRERRGVPAV